MVLAVIVLGALMFISLFTFLAYFVYSLISESRKEAKERGIAHYHEAAHAIMAMYTGMGFLEVNVKENNLHFGFMSHQPEQYCKTRNSEVLEFHELTERDRLENSLMTALAGYVAEVIHCRKKTIPTKQITSGDIELVNSILQDNKFLYEENHMDCSDYLDKMVTKTNSLLIQEQGAYLLLADALKERKIIKEDEAWEIISPVGFSSEVFNPYASDVSFFDVSFS